MPDVTADAFTGPHGHDHAHHAAHMPALFAPWFMSPNHQHLGTLSLIFALIARIFGGVISCLMRLHSAAPGVHYMPDLAGFLDAPFPLCARLLPPPAPH